MIRMPNALAGCFNALGRRIAVVQSLLSKFFVEQTPIVLSKEEAFCARYCFLGEFGYEMISWLPYLLFLKEHLGIPIRTVGRPGSSIFYYFSDEHMELDASYVGDVWGNPVFYQHVGKEFPGEILVYPGKDLVNRRHISIGGYEWRNRNIHSRIDEAHYVKPDYSRIISWSPLPGKDIVVINNKNFLQWQNTYEKPVNYFSRSDLERLRDLLLSKGYGVVYNHFVELTSHDVYFALNDQGVFGKDNNTYDMQTLYASCTDVGQRNRMQIALYNTANLIIGPQGGNLYLPAICRRPLYILMRVGDYIDYLELGRLYDIDVEVFYESRHMESWIASNLPPAQQMNMEEA